jgi:signal transduction histidine kinase/CheY-like chemotaxis protein
MLGAHSDVTSIKEREAEIRRMHDDLDVVVQERTSQLRLAQEQQRLLDAKVQEAQKLESLGVLAGGIAHDFNNLLVGILGYADIALEKLPQLSPARPLIERIKTGGLRAADLCNQMLAYSGKGKFVIQPLDLNELVEEMAHLVEVSVSKKALLRYQLGANLPAIGADATQVRQILLNLIMNASEAIGDRSGVISISTGAQQCDGSYLESIFLPGEDWSAGVYVFVEVSDTGCGMSRETQERIFDPFFSTKFTGRGLGLAAVLGIVRGHSGAIKIYSEENGGTTFKILFPAVTQAAIPLLRFAGESESWRGSGTVLLVDDDETVLTVAGMMLEHAGFEVVTATDGKEGLAVFREHRDRIVCVMLDLTMPHMDGEETFRELRRIDPEIRVILTSGYNEQDASSRFAGKGLAGFVKKPFEASKLLGTLRAVLEPAAEPS